MPLWHIYHPPTTFTTTASKRSLATALTKLYTDIGLPAFYVNVFFHSMQPSDVWIGGEVLERPFVRLVGEQIAVRMPDQDEVYAEWLGKVDEAIKPHIHDMGYDWEYHIDETERRLWKVKGLYAPPFGSEEENMWAKENKAVPWKKE
ncbi:hypothetical protein K432DRAFT_360432 [Lepidopterella palustris CBS 459.81]|uniref:Tautomerase cis-CaaD-like domain-containing protein n=1 Tax=Lepidopterella palustris CBS 459.81 TaxID=1314670 RepID=A0A8E2E375_9PEZI|nr:hypothetical protein K432DRAFT_360432 [Lepidopterella palustris CBS 459.81]